jgi:putative flavoprotein involved in K+ transport
MDIWWWLDQIGTFTKTIDEVDDPIEARHEGALQLVGRGDHRDVDVPALQALGIRVIGRLSGIDGDDLTFADDLERTTRAADERLRRLLLRIDDHIDAAGLAREVLPAETPLQLRPDEPITRLHARRDGIAAVVWATGYRRAYPWLRIPVLDPKGEILQRRGVTPVPGLYVVGQRFQHRRDSNFIDGVRHDASYVTRHIAGRVGHHPAEPSLSQDAS